MRLQHILAILILLAVSLLCGCNSDKHPKLARLSVEQLTATPEKYRGQVLTISGCYFRSPERSVLQTCEKPDFDQRIWLERERWVEPMLSLNLPKELRHEESPDEKRSRAAWEKLPDCQDSPVHVVVTGRFDTIGLSIHPTKAEGFGHLGMFNHRLILLDVSEAKIPTVCAVP
jgi:hypothetical protein